MTIAGVGEAIERPANAGDYLLKDEWRAVEQGENCRDVLGRHVFGCVDTKSCNTEPHQVFEIGGKRCLYLALVGAQIGQIDQFAILNFPDIFEVSDVVIAVAATRR